VIRYQNLVGQRFVSLVPGAARPGPCRSGAVSRSSAPGAVVDLSALLNGFQPLFSVLQPAEVNKLADNIVALLQGSGPADRPAAGADHPTDDSIADRDQVIGS